MDTISDEAVEQKNVELSPLRLADSSARIYQYGVRISVDCMPRLHEEFFLAHDLYNKMVAEVRPIISGAIEWLVEKGGHEADLLRRRLDELKNAYREARAADDRPLQQKIAPDLNAATKEWYQLMSQLRKDNKDELNAKFLSKIRFKKECGICDLRRQAVAEGLNADTASSVLTSVLQGYSKKWARFELPDFERILDVSLKTLTIQFKHAASPESLLSGERSELKITMGEGKYKPFSYKIGAGDKRQSITGTILLHRPLPEGAKITYARLVEKRIGKDLRHYIQFVVGEINDAFDSEAQDNRKEMAVLCLGWAESENGRRIAALASSDNEAREVFALPSDVDTSLAHVAEIQSMRDRKRDEIVTFIKGLTLNDAPDGLREELLAFKRLRAGQVSQKRLARIVISYRNNFQDYAPELLARLDEWRKKDKMALQEASHLAFRARKRREKVYENMAKSIATSFKRLAIGSPNLAAAARIKKKKTGEHTELRPAARSGRQVAALSELKEKIMQAASKEGVVVVGLKNKLGNICNACGSSVVIEEDNVICSNCGMKIDKLLNAALLGVKGIGGDFSVMEDLHLGARQDMEGKLLKRDERKKARIQGRIKQASEERDERSSCESVK